MPEQISQVMSVALPFFALWALINQPWGERIKRRQIQDNKASEQRGKMTRALGFPLEGNLIFLGHLQVPLCRLHRVLPKHTKTMV